jgi:DNA-binding CsgD family transcriptional regulator
MSTERNGRASGRQVTPRELEVLALIADGNSTSEIAERLWITEETVRTHVRRLFERLEARTRAHAVSIAYREGFLEIGQKGGAPM